MGRWHVVEEFHRGQCCGGDLGSAQEVAGQIRSSTVWKGCLGKPWVNYRLHMIIYVDICLHMIIYIYIYVYIWLYMVIYG